jgi:hypothetical protein
MTTTEQAAEATKAPKAPKKTPEQKAAEKATKDAAKAAEKAAKQAAKPVVVKAEKDVKYGVTRPSTGVTKLVWDTADQLSTEKKDAVDRASLVKALEGKVEVGTIHTQYGRWRKYYGLTETKEARQARLKVIRDRKDAEKLAKKEQKEAAKKEVEQAAAAKAAEKQPEPAAA